MFNIENITKCAERQDPMYAVFGELSSSNGFSKEALKNRKEEVLRLELFFNEVNCLPHLAQFNNLTQVIFFGTDISHMEKIDFNPSLNELWLCESRLKRIPKLCNCEALQVLYIYGNMIARVENLDHLTRLEFLSLAQNQLTTTRGFEKLAELTDLNIGANDIKFIGEEIKQNKKLSKLDISGNPIESVVQMSPLAYLNLQELNISNPLYPQSPLCRQQNYQLQIFYTLQSLRFLNGEEIPQDMTAEAVKILSRKHSFYRMKKRILRRTLPSIIKGIQKIAQKRLAVPLTSRRELVAELNRIESIFIENNEENALQEARVRKKTKHISERLEHWENIYKRIKFEEKLAIQSVRNKFKVDEELLRLELQSGGNLRFEDIYEPEEEEGKEPSHVKQIWNQMENLLTKTVSETRMDQRKKALGVERFKLNRITKIFHRPKRLAFDEEIDEINETSQYVIPQSIRDTFPIASRFTKTQKVGASLRSSIQTTCVQNILSILNMYLISSNKHNPANRSGEKGLFGNTCENTGRRRQRPCGSEQRSNNS
ncbi:unnamed protein product [Oikopleura dioica]|uniref:Uncharacterized protein n=1 Tax=Oikopleura dioica TaxID=34765 RepID=E4YM40_OIKDI|nr:unnamed protein product [Oikopleura dioica]